MAAPRGGVKNADIAGLTVAGTVVAGARPGHIPVRPIAPESLASPAINLDQLEVAETSLLDAERRATRAGADLDAGESPACLARDDAHAVTLREPLTPPSRPFLSSCGRFAACSCRAHLGAGRPFLCPSPGGLSTRRNEAHRKPDRFRLRRGQRAALSVGRRYHLCLGLEAVSLRPPLHIVSEAIRRTCVILSAHEPPHLPVPPIVEGKS